MLRLVFFGLAFSLAVAQFYTAQQLQEHLKGEDPILVYLYDSEKPASLHAAL